MASERWRRDANDGERDAVYAKRATDRVEAPTKSLAPEPVADDDGRGCRGMERLVRREEAADRGTGTEEGQVVACGREDHADDRRVVARDEGGRNCGVRRGIAKQAALIPHDSKHGVRHVENVTTGAAVDLDDLLRLAHERDRLQEHAVDQTEHGRVRAHADRQRQNGEQRERGAAAEGADGQSDVGTQEPHQRCSRRDNGDDTARRKNRFPDQGGRLVEIPGLGFQQL